MELLVFMNSCIYTMSVSRSFAQKIYFTIVEILFLWSNTIQTRCMA